KPRISSANVSRTNFSAASFVVNSLAFFRTVFRYALVRVRTSHSGAAYGATYVVVVRISFKMDTVPTKRLDTKSGTAKASTISFSVSKAAIARTTEPAAWAET